MLYQLTAYISKLYQRVETPQPYGSELERYILARQPQSIYDVEKLTRQFDTELSQGRIL